MNDLSLHILDIIQNSIAAQATFISLYVCVDEKRDVLTISIADNGMGMTKQQIAKVEDPFFTTRTTRRVGLGIPLFKQSAEQSGGGLKIESAVGVGTVITATFGYTNIDRPPMGDIENTFELMVSCNPKIQFELINENIN